MKLTFRCESFGCRRKPYAPDTACLGLMQNYQQTPNRSAGPTEILVSGNTFRLKDYSRLVWERPMFDPEEKKRRHETVFLQECVKAAFCRNGLKQAAFIRFVTV